MTISSAYIFAKQIKAGEVPMPANVYFEDGAFNPVWVGNNFDFTDSKVVKDVFSDAEWAARHSGSYITARKVIHAVGSAADPWMIENGDLVFKQTAFVSYNESMSEVFLPINLALSQIDPYVTRMYASIMQTDIQSGADNATRSRQCYLDYPTMDALEVSNTGQIGPSRATDGYEENWCELFPTIETWSQDVPCYFSLRADGYKEIRIKKIWFTDLKT